MDALAVENTLKSKLEPLSHTVYVIDTIEQDFVICMMFFSWPGLVAFIQIPTATRTISCKRMNECMMIPPTRLGSRIICIALFTVTNQQYNRLPKKRICMPLTHILGYEICSAASSQTHPVGRLSPIKTICQITHATRQIFHFRHCVL